MRAVAVAIMLLATPQRAVMSYGASCLHVTEKTWYDAPLVDGKPDWAHGKVHGLVVDKACGVIRVVR